MDSKVSLLLDGLLRETAAGQQYRVLKVGHARHAKQGAVGLSAPEPDLSEVVMSKDDQNVSGTFSQVSQIQHNRYRVQHLQVSNACDQAIT